MRVYLILYGRLSKSIVADIIIFNLVVKQWVAVQKFSINQSRFSRFSDKQTWTCD